MSRLHYKKYCFYSLIIILFVVIFICFNNSKTDVDVDKIKRNRVSNDYFVTGMSYNSSYFCYDIETGTFYTNDEINVSKIKVVSPYKVKFYFEKVSDSEYNVFVYSNRFYREMKLFIVDIPLVSISNISDLKYLYKENSSENLVNFGTTDGEQLSEINFGFFDNHFLDHKLSKVYNSYDGHMRVRGATSFYFPKKSYRVILNKNTSFLGMYKDEDWILDALYTDKSKVRNKLCSDLWNKINDNQFINNDLNGNYVELFVDNRYMGLYILKEKVVKKNLSVGVDGLVAKSIMHSNEEIKNNIINGNLDYVFEKTSETLGNFELKYYSDQSLKNFYNKLQEVYSYNDYEHIYNNFDIDNYINYYLFILFIHGNDNMSKNLYYSMEDSESKIYITPWDMDLTFGLVFDNSSKLYSENFDPDYVNAAWIYDFLYDMDSDILALLKQRYWELREDIITMDTINNYLDSYEKILVDSGAAARDSERWYQYNVKFEIERIRQWTNYRIQFLDEYFK